MPTCPACGSGQQHAAFCTACGAATGQGGEDARPAARSVARRGVLIGAGAGAAIALVAGLAFGIPAVLKDRGTDAAPQAGPSAAGLQVAHAPDLSQGGGSFRNGYQESWRFSESTSSEPHRYTLLAQAGDILVVNDFLEAGDPDEPAGDPRTGLIGISRQTGKKAWTGPQTAGVSVDCAPEPLGHWVVCTIGQYSGTATLVTIDARTGKQGPGLTGLGPDAPLAGFTVADGALYVAKRDPGASPGEESGQVTVIKFTDPATIAWQQTHPVGASDPGSGSGVSAGRAEGPVVLLDGDGAIALDAASGQLLASDPDRARVGLVPGPALVRLGAGDVAIEAAPLLGGKTYCSVTTRSTPLAATTTGPPIAVDGPGRVIGFDPATCKQTWQANLPFQPFRSAWNGGEVAVISGHAGEVAGVRVKDGSIAWTSNLPNHTGSFGEGITDYPSDGVRGMVQLKDGTILVQYLLSLDMDGASPATEHTLALDPGSGSQVWEAPSGLFGGTYYTGVVPGPSLQDGYLIAQEERAIARWDPADEWSLEAHAASLPAGVPSCPGSMSPLTFSRYQDGAVLVCGSKEGTFAVVARDAAGNQLPATTLSFTGRSCEVGLTGGRTIRLSLGGAWVDAADGARRSQFVASEAWDYRAGATTLAPVAKAAAARQCPAGTWPVSLSAWEGGWLLVCGTSAGKPAWLAYSDTQAGQGEAATVNAEAGGYCGTSKDGQACAFAAPATARLPGAGGVQRTAATSSFDEQGPGTAHGDSGAYGVKAPDDTAKDQVRYLAEILRSSAQTRADLLPVLDRVNDKTVGSAEIAALRTVSDSRRDLRAAVLAAPVDKVPGGQELVAELAYALQVSEDCDRLYVTWAGIVQAGQDDAAIVAKWRPKAEESDAAKQVFLDRWNSAIVPAFQAPAFTVEQI